MKLEIAGVPDSFDESSSTVTPSSARRSAVGVGDASFAQIVNWRMTIGYAILHLGALSAPFFFTWKAAILAAVSIWITYLFGFCVGFHRLLAHGSFRTYRPIRYFLAFLGSIGGQRGVLYWVAVHRKHHVFSDGDQDPHTPRHGRLWSFAGWILRHYPTEYLDDTVRRFSPDLLREPMLRRLHAAYVPLQVASAAVLFACGYWGWDAYTGASFVVWGFCLRLAIVFDFTLLVNTVSHSCGYRNYETNDDSRNVWWLALIAGGEGWHNNHHAFQRLARHGHRRWELDPAYGVICLMEKCGLAWNVVHDVPQRKPVEAGRADHFAP